MKIIHRFSEFPDSKKSVVLTIGNFDGMHLGHQAVLEALQTCAKQQHAETVVLTFANHPSTILQPETPARLLCSLPHKLELLEKARIDWLVLLAFTKDFANQTAEAFLENLKTQIAFTHLILGYDAVLGKDRKGDPASLQLLARKLNFAITYLPAYCVDDMKISSSRIRHLIAQGDLTAIEKLLGRKYSFLGKMQTGNGQGKQLGFPTANFDVKDMCLPPYGVYAVKVIQQGMVFNGIANLGVAPTIRIEKQPILEVHLLDSQIIPAPDALWEVIFHSYIRPEQKFVSVEDLKAQISKDIQQASHLLASDF